jgi:hypothetical protein
VAIEKGRNRYRSKQKNKWCDEPYADRAYDRILKTVLKVVEENEYDSRQNG